MLKKVLCLLTIFCFSLISFAFDYPPGADSWTQNFPQKYLSSETKVVKSSKSACNQGAEPFRSFIRKFRKDPKFRNSRIKMSESEMNEFSDYMNWCDRNSEICFDIYHKHEKCNRSFCTWFNISADEVSYKGDFSNPCDKEWGGSNSFAHFKRIDGKWYLVSFFNVD